MAFPTIAATSQGNDAVNTTNHTVNLPTGIASGHLLLIFMGMDGNTSITWPAGWSILATDTNAGGDGTLSVAYRIADGSEGSSISVTTAASEAGSYICWRVTGWHGTTPPEAGTPATGTSTTPDPPSVTASWGSADNLFIAVTVWGSSSTNISGYPTNYSVSQMTDGASNSNIGAIALAGRELAAASDDPGTFSIISTAWVANTIVVRPAAGGGSTAVPVFVHHLKQQGIG